MDARGIAGAGALVFLLSLIMPWYSVELAGSSAGAEGGWSALGTMAWPALLLAVAAGWQGLARVHAAAPAAAAAGLALIVLVQAAQVPELGNDPLSRAVLDSAGVGYERAYGLWTAAGAAALALFGATKTAADGPT